jgi:hypothetical protein
MLIRPPYEEAVVLSASESLEWNKWHGALLYSRANALIDTFIYREAVIRIRRQD